MKARNSFTTTLTADVADDSASFAMTGSFRVNVSGTFGGGAVSIQEQFADGSWLEIADTAKTADADFIVDNFDNNKYRFVLSGSTAPDLNCSVKGVVSKSPE